MSADMKKDIGARPGRAGAARRKSTKSASASMRHADLGITIPTDVELAHSQAIEAAIAELAASDAEVSLAEARLEVALKCRLLAYGNAHIAIERAILGMPQTRFSPGD